MSLGLPSVSLTGQGAGAGRGAPAAEAMPPGWLFTFSCSCWVCAVPARALLGSFLDRTCLSQQGAPHVVRGSGLGGATQSRRKGRGSGVGEPLYSGPSSASGIRGPARPPEPVYLRRQTGILGQGAQRQRRKETFSEEVRNEMGN